MSNCAAYAMRNIETIFVVSDDEKLKNSKMCRLNEYLLKDLILEKPDFLFEKKNNWAILPVYKPRFIEILESYNLSGLDYTLIDPDIVLELLSIQDMSVNDENICYNVIEEKYLSISPSDVIEVFFKDREGL